MSIWIEFVYQRQNDISQKQRCRRVFECDNERQKNNNIFIGSFTFFSYEKHFLSFVLFFLPLLTIWKKIRNHQYFFIDKSNINPKKLEVVSGVYIIIFLQFIQRKMIWQIPIMISYSKGVMELLKDFRNSTKYLFEYIMKYFFFYCEK